MIGCFRKTFCLVKYTALQRKFRHRGKFFLSSHFATIAKKRAICENNFLIMFFIIFLKQATVKILIYTVEVRLGQSSFQVKTSKSHNKNDKPFRSCRSKTSDGNTRKQCLQCMNTVLKNMNGTENFYYKKLLKAKLLTSKHFPSLLFLQIYVRPL